MKQHGAYTASPAKKTTSAIIEVKIDKSLQWKFDMFCTLQNYFNKIPTRPLLGDLLITSLSKWLNELAIFSNFPQSTIASFPPDKNWMEAIVCQQICLGMEQSPARLLSPSENRLQEIFGNIMDTGVIQIIWKHVYQNWDARNADLQGVDATM